MNKRYDITIWLAGVTSDGKTLSVHLSEDTDPTMNWVQIGDKRLKVNTDAMIDALLAIKGAYK